MLGDRRTEHGSAEESRAGSEQLLAGVREELSAARQMLEGEQAQCTRCNASLACFGPSNQGWATLTNLLKAMSCTHMVWSSGEDQLGATPIIRVHLHGT